MSRVGLAQSPQRKNFKCDCKSYQEETDCSYCEGSGDDPDLPQPCVFCAGKGWRMEWEYESCSLCYEEDEFL